MLMIQFFICIIAPVTLFQEGRLVLGTVGVINLVAYTWSLVNYIKAAGAPPAT